MELLMVVFFLSIFALAVIINIVVLRSAVPLKSTLSKAKLAETKVNDALSMLDMKSYVLFENVILPSRGNTAHTEIDHIVVSPYGIFCIETKAHSGSIYAYERNRDWAQYLRGQKYTFNSPHRQNYKHIKAIEDLVGSDLRAAVHSYVVFPNATQVVTDSNFVYCNLQSFVAHISRHKQPVYNIAECTRIMRALAYASSQKDALLSVHIDEVQSYLATKLV